MESQIFTLVGLRVLFDRDQGTSEVQVSFPLVTRRPINILTITSNDSSGDIPHHLLLVLRSHFPSLPSPSTEESRVNPDTRRPDMR